MQQHQLNTTSVYRRLSLVGLSVGLLIVVLNMWVKSATTVEQMQADSMSQQTRLMLQQSAKVALRQIKAKKTAALGETLNDLAQDPYILQAVVVDRTGKAIAKSEGAKSAKDLFITQHQVPDTLPPHDNTVSIAKPPKVTMYVIDITEKERLVGYLKVGYLKDLALAEPQAFYQMNMQKMLLMMLLSGVIGFMLTRGFSRFSRNSYRIVDRA